MPDKFPIDFQPRQFNAVLISKETGQSIPAIAEDWLNASITPEPLPVDEIKDEPTTPLVFQKSFTVKIPKKDQRAFKRMLRGGRKFPRKLKKAGKHIQMVTEVKTIENQTQDHFFGSYAVVYFRTKDGYPYTKWVRKAIWKATHELDKERRRIMEDMVKYTKEDATRLERIMKGK